MEFEDKVTITAPEGITIELWLAGIGSRAIAALLDGAIKGVLTIAVIAALLGTGALFDAETIGGSGPASGFFVGLAVAFVVIFFVNFAYDVLFETFASGRTPGKRWTGLRVVRASGGPVTFVPSAIRNLVRIVDSLPGVYAIGLIAMLVSSKNQRLGDIAAGTLVIRERREAAPAPDTAGIAPAVDPPKTLDVSAVTGQELATVRAFLARRQTLDPDARARLAWELVERLRPRLTGMQGDMHPEVLLEQVAAAKAARS